jgi:hypothetical protein
MIERLRQSGIRLDREGRFWHEGTQVTHERFQQTLLRWLDVLPDGRPILRLDATRYAYVEVDDALLLVLSARWQGDRALLTLNDDTEEELAYDTLCVDSRDDSLYCLVRGRRLEARITTPAYYVLAERIAPAGKQFVLHAAGRAFEIAARGQ